MLRTFDDSIILDIDRIMAIDHEDKMESYGYSKYTVRYHNGPGYNIFCWWSDHITLEEKYPEFTEWVHSHRLSKD